MKDLDSVWYWAICGLTVCSLIVVLKGEQTAGVQLLAI